MPELPEVETVRRGIEDYICKRKITDIFLSNKRLRYNYPSNIATDLVGNEFSEINRRSKYLLFHLKHTPQILVLHLGMSGKLLLNDSSSYQGQKHDHFILNFATGSNQNSNDMLVFNDARRFGFVDIISSHNWQGHKYFQHLGAEPLENEFTEDYLYNKLKNKSKPIKTALMDAENVVGVGNIYASEALFRGGISPVRAANSLKQNEIRTLVENVKIILQEAINSGGSTLRDYVRSDGSLGYFQFSHFVYGRENEPCRNCNKGIIKIKQQGRSSFYCPSCQK